MRPTTAFGLMTCCAPTRLSYYEQFYHGDLDTDGLKSRRLTCCFPRKKQSLSASPVRLANPCPVGSTVMLPPGLRPDTAPMDSRCCSSMATRNLSDSRS